MRFAVRIRQIKELLESYSYPSPFSQHLQDFFRKNKQLGSKDRKQLRQVVYAYFRYHNLFPEYSTTDKILIAAYLCSEISLEDALHLSENQENLAGLLNKSSVEIIDERLTPDIFPAVKSLNEDFDNKDFFKSLLYQPYVWIAVRKGKGNQVRQEFDKAGIQYHEENTHTWRLNPEARLDSLQSFSKGYFRIQDLSSQQTAELFRTEKGETWWDACAGAGGKSLSLLDKDPSLLLYDSDIRNSILRTLQERLKLYGYQSTVFEADLENESPKGLPEFDGIIVDAPCSGSGTWARNPESFVYFSPSEIKKYQGKQLAILRHVFPLLKKDKPLIYITCSVYKAENEEVIRLFSENRNVEIEEQKYLKGYLSGAENMFICRLVKRG